jgi:hypothetical protein
MGDPGEFKQYAVLTFQFDPGKRRATLTLQGPKLPGVDVAPAIGMRRDADGSYHFLIGGGDFVYPPREIPGELRRLLGGADAPKGGPAPVQMPTRAQLRKSDGSFMPYAEYELKRKLFHSPLLEKGQGVIWPQLPPALYQVLLDFYSGETMILRPLPPPPPPDLGDFPEPPTDVGVG